LPLFAQPDLNAVFDAGYFGFHAVHLIGEAFDHLRDGLQGGLITLGCTSLFCLLL
jgi:hypothetical protein